MARQGYRKGPDDNVKQSYRKLRISEEDGWTADMRKRYFQMAEQAHKIIIDHDYTNLDIREKKFGSRDIKRRDVKVEGGVNLKTFGIWSDSVFDSVKYRMEQLIKYTIEKEEEKRKNGKKYKKVNRLEHIRHHHTRDFILEKLENGTIGRKTADKYYGDLQKFNEISKDSGLRNARENKFLKESTKERIKEEYGNNSKEKRTRSRKSDGSYGYSLDEAKKLIDAADDLHVKTALEALTYQGYRKDTLFKLQWKDVWGEEGVMDESVILDKNKMKSGRVQKVETNDENYKRDLYYLKTQKGFTQNDLVFGKNENGVGFSPYLLEKEIRKLCDKTGVEWVGFHGFRTSTVEYYRAEKLSNMYKREVIEGLLRMVNLEVMGNDGKMYKPHNPMVPKMETVYGKDGKPLKRKNRYGGEYTVRRKVLGEDGKPIMEPKFTYEKLERYRRDYLDNLYISQQISHNRSDANQPYENHEKK